MTTSTEKQAAYVAEQHRMRELYGVPSAKARTFKAQDTTVIESDPQTIEHVARAICRAWGVHPEDTYITCGVPAWKEWTEEAKAAIQAMSGDDELPTE